MSKQRCSTLSHAFGVIALFGLLSSPARADDPPICKAVAKTSTCQQVVNSVKPFSFAMSGKKGKPAECTVFFGACPSDGCGAAAVGKTKVSYNGISGDVHSAVPGLGVAVRFPASCGQVLKSKHIWGGLDGKGTDCGNKKLASAKTCKDVLGNSPIHGVMPGSNLNECEVTYLYCKNDACGPFDKPQKDPFKLYSVTTYVKKVKWALLSSIEALLKTPCEALISYLQKNK